MLSLSQSGSLSMLSLPLSIGGRLYGLSESSLLTVVLNMKFSLNCLDCFGDSTDEEFFHCRSYFDGVESSGIVLTYIHYLPIC